jgi:hypothetical protein
MSTPPARPLRECGSGGLETIVMPRRYFEHLYCEICVAVERRISRYDLWLLMWDNGGDPYELTREQARSFVDHNLSALLAEQSCALSPRARNRLERRILRFDPRHPTPEEWLESVCDQFRKVA